MTIKGVIFDKDGTLFDFRATWDGWAASVIRDLSAGDDAMMSRMAEAAHFDLAEGQFSAQSPIIACTHREAAEILGAAMGAMDVDALEWDLAERATRAALAPAVDLSACLGALRGQGIRLGLMTNNSESTARAHLGTAGVLELFDAVLGSDSGHGGKPDAAPLLACARQMEVAPAQCIMVGDSAHDLVAGRAAGMGCVGVLTGTAGRGDLIPFADDVFDDIGALPDWLAAGALV